MLANFYFDYNFCSEIAINNESSYCIEQQIDCNVTAVGDNLFARWKFSPDNVIITLFDGKFANRKTSSE